MAFVTLFYLFEFFIFAFGATIFETMNDTFFGWVWFLIIHFSLNVNWSIDRLMKMKFEKLLNNRLVERNLKKDQRVKPMIEQVQVQIHQCGRRLQWQGQADNHNNSLVNHHQVYNRPKHHQVNPDSQ